MKPPSQNEVTQLLLAWSDGDKAALEELTPLVYAELRRLAERHMRRERAGHPLQTTALVNEAYVRLIDLRQVRWQNRAHFFGVAAQLMRHILVDFARARLRAERGGYKQQVPLEEAAVVSNERCADFIALDDALKSLAEIDPRKSRMVELRFFGGLTVDETAEALNVSPRTVMYEWSLARDWLYRELRDGRRIWRGDP
jgi:RNA polymerase sigma factor (TIGR02999 family)